MHGPWVLYVPSAARLGDLDALRWLWVGLHRNALVGAQASAVRRRANGALAAEGNKREAEDSFAQALETYHLLGLRWEWSRTALDALAALPRESRVRKWAAEARATFQTVDAVAFVALTDDLLGSGPAARTAPSTGGPSIANSEEPQTDSVAR